VNSNISYQYLYVKLKIDFALTVEAEPQKEAKQWRGTLSVPALRINKKCKNKAKKQICFIEVNTAKPWHITING
jgi:hypothetical protein